MSSLSYQRPSVINNISGKISDLYYDICYWFSDKCCIVRNLIEYRKIVSNISDDDNLAIVKMLDFQLKILKEKIILETITSISETHIKGNVQLFEKTERLSTLLNNFLEDNFYDRFGGNDLKYDCDFHPDGKGGFNFIDNTTDEQNLKNSEIQDNIDANTEKEWNEMMELLGDVMKSLMKYR